MLRESGEGAEEEVEGVLEEHGKCWDGRVRREGRREGFNVGPGQVDIEEEEKDAEASNGGLDVYAVIILSLPRAFGKNSLRRAARHRARGD